MPRTSATMESRSSKSLQNPPAISYRLSDTFFLDYGWTTKPNTSLAFPVVVMKAKFSHATISPWFQERSEELKMKYPDGSVLCVASKNGTGKIYYPNGKLAIKVEKGGIHNFRTRVWVYSPGEVDQDGKKHPWQLCALFDSLGNGVVYDSCMKKRLVYNQKEGILWDSPNGIPVFWKWHDITFTGSFSIINDEDEKHKILREPPKPLFWVVKDLKEVLPKDSKATTEKEGEKPNRVSAPSSPSVLSAELTKSEIEFRETFEHSRYLDTRKVEPRNVSPVKPIVLRLNKYLALRILSQSEISLRFLANTHQTTLNIGVLYNPFDKLKTVEIDDPSVAFEKVICPFECFPPKTKSMLNFKMVVQAIRVASCNRAAT